MKLLYSYFLIFLWLVPNLPAEKLLIFRHGSENFEEVVKTVKEEIDGELEIVDHILTQNSTYEEFAQKTRTEKPNLLLLLDNKAVDFAKKFNLEKDAYAKNLKGVAAMGLNLRKELKDNKNICAVEYEVPAYTIITSYRYLVQNNIKNVLVFYRESQHRNIIEQAQKMLLKEKINLRAINSEAYGNKVKQVQFFLEKNVLREMYRSDVDVVWVLSDSVMINNDNFGDVWINAARRNRVPFISGIKSFTSKKMDFCSYSASPNHNDLGSQITEMIFALVEKTPPEEIGIEYIVSVAKSANLEKIHDNKVKINEGRLTDIKVIEK